MTRNHRVSVRVHGKAVRQVKKYCQDNKLEEATEYRNALNKYFEDKIAHSSF